MKLNAGKRVVMFFHWLFSLLIGAAFAVHIIRPEWTTELYNRVIAKLNATQVMIIGIAILAIYVILAVVQACIIFHRNRRVDRGFITVDSSDSGRVRIAISAIEQMVRQSVISIDGITEMRISIENRDEAIAINIMAILQNGCHVPTVTMNMQRAIRQFVEMNCGVAVREVSISINAVANAGEGGRRRGRRKDDMQKTSTAYAADVQHFDPPVVSEAPAATSDPVVSVSPVNDSEYETFDSPSVDAESRTEDPVFILDPEPITLHFDHQSEQSDVTPLEDGEGTEPEESEF